MVYVKGMPAPTTDSIGEEDPDTALEISSKGLQR